jgi:hypothetical protein
MLERMKRCPPVDRAAGRCPAVPDAEVRELARFAALLLAERRLDGAAAGGAP